MAQVEPTLKAHNEHVRRDGVETEELTYISTDDGSIILLICPVCHHITTHCLHVNNTWNEEGSQLTCDLCGIDGT